MGYKIFTYYFVLLSVAFVTVKSSSGANNGTLTFGLPPFANPAVLQQNFLPLAEYLSSATGQPVRLTFSPNYMNHIMNLGQGKIDIAYVGPSPYVKVKDKFDGISLLAKLQLKNDRNNQVVFFTGRQSPITTLADLKGRTFAFGDYQSYGSHFLPRFILHEKEVPIKNLAAYDFVGSHDNVVLSVLHGDFHAGGVRFDIFKKYEKRPLRILFGPVRIPPHVLVCRTSLAEDLKKDLRVALLKLEDERVLKAINPTMQAFLPVEDKEFSRAREVINFIESR